LIELAERERRASFDALRADRIHLPCYGERGARRAKKGYYLSRLPNRKIYSAKYLEFLSSDPLIIYAYFNSSSYEAVLTINSYEAVLTINFNGMSSIYVFYETSKQGNILLRPEINFRYINAGIVDIQANLLVIQKNFDLMCNIKALCDKWTGYKNFIGAIA
jgi:hypothetical protein